jgi:hypothetical protein
MDTGAVFSVFPHTSTSPPCGPALAGAAGQPNPCWGEKQLQLSLNGKAFSWSFLLATVQFPILAVDFLMHFGLLVNSAGNWLVDRQTFWPIPSSPPFVRTHCCWPRLYSLGTFPLRWTIKELQVFLGLVKFYRMFLPGVAATCGLLLMP